MEPWRVEIIIRSAEGPAGGVRLPAEGPISPRRGLREAEPFRLSNPIWTTGEYPGVTMETFLLIHHGTKNPNLQRAARSTSAWELKSLYPSAEIWHQRSINESMGFSSLIGEEVTQWHKQEVVANISSFRSRASTESILRIGSIWASDQSIGWMEATGRLVPTSTGAPSSPSPFLP